MKKRIQLVLVTLLCTSILYSQEYPNAPIPDFYPASPEASGLGAYGNIERALQHGNMSFSVPIHTFQLGNYSWPVALNYAYGGLLLEGKPSIIGLGWNISGTGAVRREVRGLPDEHPEGYYGPRNRGERIKSYVNGEDFSLTELKKYLSGEWDKEVDIYHVQVGGVSFSYKKDENGNPVYLSQHNHIVSYTNQEITVTDDQGIIYIFADIENNEPSDATPNTAFEYTITWNLSEIIYPNGRKLTFQYDDDQYISYDFYATGGNHYFPTGLEDDTADGTTGPSYGTGNYKDGVNQSIINRKILHSITSSDRTTLTFSISEIEGRKVYNNISVSKAGDLNAYAFSYTGARDVLTKITKNGQLVYGFEYYDQNNIPDFIDHISDHARAQDDWRFYNASANTAAISVPASGHTVDKSPNFLATRIGAMKKIIYPTGGYSLIDYAQNQIKKDYASLGSGTNADISTSVTFNKQIVLKLQSDNSSSAPEVKTSVFTKTFEQPTVATISSTIRGTLQKSHLFMSISYSGSCPPSIDQPEPGLVSDDYFENAPYLRNILNETPQMCPTMGVEFGPDNGDPGYYSESHDSRGRIIIKPGTYTFKITNDYNRSSDAYGEIKVRFYEAPTNTTGFVNANVGGIRVEKIEHYSDPSSVAKTQYFDYDTEDNLSSGLLLNKFQNEVSFNIVNYSAPTPENPSGRTEYDVVAYRLNRFNSLTVNQSTPVYYTQIKEYDNFNLIEASENTEDSSHNGFPLIPLTNDDGTLVYSDIGNADSQVNYIKTFPNGYKITKFEAPAQNYDFEHPNYPQNQDLDKGRIKMVAVYKAKDSSTTALQKSEHSYKQFRGLVDQDYQDYNTLHPWSLKIAQKLNIIADCRIQGACDETPIPSQEHYQIERYIIKPYRELHTNYKPLSTINTSYYDQNGEVQNVTTTAINSYNDYFALHETTTQNSNGDKIKSTYKYPYDNNSDFDNLSTTASTAISGLKTTNQIAVPIQTEAYKIEGTTETLLFTKRTDYTSWGENQSGNTLWLPEKTLIAKGTNALEERLIYYEYDSYGNPIEVAQVDGVHVYYIWGYDGQFPIAKINNFTSAQANSIKTFIDAAINASNEDVSFPNGSNSTSEQTLKDALEAIRTHQDLQNSEMSYYTYDPLIGITSKTDTRGYTMYYEYDDLKRLEFIKDQDGNLISENKYHYQN